MSRFIHIRDIMDLDPYVEGVKVHYCWLGYSIIGCENDGVSGNSKAHPASRAPNLHGKKLQSVEVVFQRVKLTSCARFHVGRMFL